MCPLFRNLPSFQVKAAEFCDNPAEDRLSFAFQTELSLKEETDCKIQHCLPSSLQKCCSAISPNVLAQLFDGAFRNAFQHFHVIDCRFPYEYNGGHIVGAINVPIFSQLPSVFPLSASNDNNNRQVLIFHCEFSSHRAPAMLRRFRKADRDRNLASYPKLDYPEVYLLDGGYKAFIEHCKANNRLDFIASASPDSCYVTMRDENHRTEERHWQRQLGDEKSSFDDQEGRSSTTTPQAAIQRGKKVKAIPPSKRLDLDI